MSVRSVLLMSVFALACAEPVWATPRDDAGAAIARCAVYADNRTYLDCVYGALQPLRTSLGLSSALPAQLRLVPQSAAPQFAASRPTPPVVAAASPPPENNGGFQFFGDGLRMAAYSFDKSGHFTVTLSNGQVWRQIATDTAYAQFGAKPSNYVVSLSPGQFGRTRMDVRGEPGSFTVQQIR